MNLAEFPQHYFLQRLTINELVDCIKSEQITNTTMTKLTLLGFIVQEQQSTLLLNEDTKIKLRSLLNLWTNIGSQKVQAAQLRTLHKQAVNKVYAKLCYGPCLDSDTMI